MIMHQHTRGNYRNLKRTRLTFRQKALRQLEALLQFMMVDALSLRPRRLRVPRVAIAVCGLAQHIQTSRYLVPLKRFRVLDSHYRDNVLSGRNKKYFYDAFRMTKPQFDFVLNLIKDHPGFATRWKKPQQRVEVQLKVALHRFTHDGSLSSFNALGRQMGVSVGSVIRYTRRCASALCAHIITYIKWPTEEEKIGVKARLGKENSEMSLEQLMSNFTLGATGVCDDRAVFTFFTTGYTGSRHDSSAYKDTPLYKEKSKYFSNDDHLIGDAAYALTPTVITAYKGKNQLPERDLFNKKLRSSRVRIEHAFGGLKGFARCLNKLRLGHTGENDMRRLNQQIMACVVLYNLLLIEDIPNDDPDPRYNFFGLMFERDSRSYADAEVRQHRRNARARFQEEDEEDIDDGGVY
ncbi:hypothetical protein EC957_006466 [Mortierella hygrophila]|uniref:DDE Tnp4 domain-containing protein n=1 Tax=Mortierella hygrophila TaxID=979708 RepID=A0A9P6JZ20_9FUNG|nr:hypothetical protein EC957_006466 [Mortierella hygrophila]